MLEKLYTGKISEAEKFITELYLLQTMKAMLPIGMETFKHSMVYKGLRFLPNKMWQITSLIDNIEGLAHFEGEPSGTRKEIKNIVNLIAQKDPDLSEAEIKDFVSVYSSMLYTANNQVRANYVNRVIRKATSRKVLPANNSVFENVAILNLPHVKALYRSAISFRNVLEQIFNVYSPTVQRFVENITKEANLFSAYESMDKTGEVSKEFIKFLTSNMKFKIADIEVSNYVEKNGDVASPEETAAWKRNFVNTMFRLHSDIDDNDFINALEFTTHNGVNKVLITADKLNDDEVIERIRDGFEKLYNTETITLNNGDTLNGKQLALDLFKYSLMNESMFYEKTGFSLIFPAQWALSFSRAFSARMESVIPQDSNVTDINLFSIKEKFLLQLVKTRPDLIGRFPKGKPKSKKVPIPGTKYKKTVYWGADNIDGRVVNYDLKYGTPYSEFLPKFISYYDAGVFALIKTPGSSDTYYVKIGDKESVGYDFSLADLDYKFDVAGLANGAYRIIDSNAIKGNRFVSKVGDYVLDDGEIIASVPYDSPNAYELKLYRVNSSKVSQNDTIYTLVPLKEELLYDRSPITIARSKVNKFFNLRSAPTIVVDTIQQIYRKNVSAKTAGATSIILSPKEANALKLPFYELSGKLTEQEQLNILEETKRILNENVSDASSAIITKDIFDSVRRYAVLNKGLVNLFYEKLNYVDSVLTPSKIKDKSTALTIALKEDDLKVENIPQEVKITKENNILYTPVIPALAAKKEGDILYAGNKNYYFIVNNNGSKIGMLSFTQELLEEMERGMTTQEFIDLYTKKLNC
jgi:hypothetical protein